MQSTYRIQFHSKFTFNDARAIVDYLRDLGITHAYASPYLKARAGSTHGYDVVDHAQLNPELGTRDDYNAWLAALSSAGMSHILDTVPNHMGVGSNDNLWWNDLLEDGEQSHFSDYFDIEWDRNPSRKLLLPILGKSYGQALEDGELKLVLDEKAGRIFVTYYERSLPIAPQTTIELLRQAGGELAKLAANLEQLPPRGLQRAPAKRAFDAKLAQVVAQSPAQAARLREVITSFNGRSGQPASFDVLHALLEKQNYRLASFRTAPELINYRRFFDVNDLAALRMDREEVFRDAYALTLQLVDAGKIAGLRVDHPDGLRDPLTYFNRLQEGRKHKPLYVAIEKILAADESLPTDWDVNGTSGYDFLNMVNSLYIDPAGEAPLTRLYERWSESTDKFSDVAIAKKRFMMQRSFQGDSDALARRLQALADADRSTRDISTGALQHALAEMVANFPVYRTYIGQGHISEADKARVHEAMEQTLRRAPSVDRTALQLVVDTLLLHWPADPQGDTRNRVEDFISRFQQLTAPVTAKGVEDTAFYVYNRLISLNEVGNDPERFGVSPATLHDYFAARQAQWPTSLSCLSTHDTKRSEDVRARLNVLSEIPAQWEANVDAWGRLNAPLHRLVDGRKAPSGNEEYLFYQTLLGVWPDNGITNELVGRVREYLTKAMREAKENTSWTPPNEGWENAVLEFATAAMTGAAGSSFLDSFRRFADQVARIGSLNSISQTILRLLAPGIPDTYQGTELIDLSLVDPDNRRPVDYSARAAMLREIRGVAGRNAAEEIVASLRHGLGSGRTKLHVTWRLLQLRRAEPDLFLKGDYVPLRVSGERAEHVFAFARRLGGKTLLVIVPRLMARLARDEEGLPVGPPAWGDTSIDVSALKLAPLHDVLTGVQVEAKEGRLALSDALARFPAAVLL